MKSKVEKTEDTGHYAAALRGKTVLVLGGTSGIGLATASLAWQRGARVIAAGRSAKGLEYARTVLDPAVLCEGVDTTDAAAVRALMQKMAPIDHILVTVGQVMSDAKLDSPRELQSEVFGSRFWSSVNIAHAAAESVQSTGSVTFTSGVAAWKPVPGAGIPAAACAAIEALARQMAVDMKPRRFNTIVPGYIDTRSLRAASALTYAPAAEGDTPGKLPRDAGVAAQDEMLARIAAPIPAGRVGRAEEVAHAAVFLMENEYVTGTALIIDGGLRLV